MADDGRNTTTESSQTNRLLRVFHSCYFHYSERYQVIDVDSLPPVCNLFVESKVIAAVKAEHKRMQKDLNANKELIAHDVSSLFCSL